MPRPIRRGHVGEQQRRAEQLRRLGEVAFRTGHRGGVREHDIERQ
jgi:hypothetical protein